MVGVGRSGLGAKNRTEEADDDWHRPNFSDREWRSMALEVHEHEALQDFTYHGITPTADERQRVLERYIFNEEEDVARLRDEYEGCWQRIELEQDERRRQVRVGSALRMYESRFESVRREKKEAEEMAAPFYDSDDGGWEETTNTANTAVVPAGRSEEEDLLHGLESLCIEALEDTIILPPPGLSTYGRIECLIDAAKERLASKSKDGDFCEEDMSTMSVGDLEFNRRAELSPGQLDDICCCCQTSKIVFPTTFPCGHIVHDHCAFHLFRCDLNCPSCRRRIPPPPRMSCQDALDGLLRAYEKSLLRCDSIIESAMILGSDSATPSEPTKTPRDREFVIAVFHELSAPTYDLGLPPMATPTDLFSTASLNTTLSVLHDIVDSGDRTKRKPYDIVTGRFETIRGQIKTATEYADEFVNEFRNQQQNPKKPRTQRSEMDKRFDVEMDKRFDVEREAFYDAANRLLLLFFKTNTVKR